MDYNFIISPLAGGIIGCLANWIAIQMLFFPISEKKILGIKVPFTPGIIPKERKRIAKGVGETVANYFLSEEVIVNAVLSKEAEIEFRKYINEFIDEKRQSSSTINEYLKKYNTGNEFVNFFGKKIADGIVEYVDSDEMTDFIVETIYKKIQKTDFDIKIKDVLPKEFIQYIKYKMADNSNEITEVIIEYMQSSSVQHRLRKLIRDNFDNSFKLKMVSAFIDIEKIYGDIFTKLINYLEQKETQMQMVEVLYKSLDKLLGNSIESILEKEILLNNNRLKEYIRLSIKKLIKESEKEVLQQVIVSKITNLFNLPLNKLLDYFGKNGVLFLQDVIIENIKDILIQESNNIFKVINISKLIEEKINSFDTNEMVDIMYDSIKKDVFVMRLFEGLIGLIIGFLIALTPYIEKMIINFFK